MKQLTNEPSTTIEAGAADTAEPTAVNVQRRRRMARENDRQEAAKETTPPSRGPSKIDQVLAQLRRAEGATLAEMIEATDWLPHTTRAALTGLRKKGHVLTKDKRGDVTCYRIAEAGQ